MTASAVDSSASDDSADPDLDAAILAHDQIRLAYIMRNRAVRRRMAILAFSNLMAGPIGLIALGLSSDSYAQRIVALAPIIIPYMLTMAGYVSVYMGVGAFDNRSMLGGMGGGFGGGMYGGGGFGSSSFGGGMFGASPAFSSPLGSVRPRLQKTPTPAGIPSAQI